MSIRILFFASLADITGMREANLNSADFSNANSVFDKFAVDFPSLEKYRSSVLIAKNSEFTGPDSPVKDGDEIAFFPPVSGG